MTKAPYDLKARIAELEKRNAELEEELFVTTQSMRLAGKVGMDAIETIEKLIKERDEH